MNNSLNSYGGGRIDSVFLYYFYPAPQKNSSFTLAEVLITLVIIGIIAAISVPVLINKYEKHQTAVKLKKVYSELSQAVSLAKVYHGNKETWDFSINKPIEFFDKYMVPFVKISESKMSEIRREGINYRNLKGDIELNMMAMSDNAKILTLVSGEQIIMATSSSYSEEEQSEIARYTILVDINGSKGPNKFGRDTFFFSITPIGIVPHSHIDGESYTKKRTRSELLNGTSGAYSYECSKKARGLWCAALIMTDGWEIKDDYPW